MSMELGIRGKRVLITGASRGLGRATALAFAEEGTQVGVIARTEPELVSLIDEMGGGSAGHAYVVEDLVEGNPLKAVKALEREIGEFDIVIHNLGGSDTARNTLSSWDEWQRALYFIAGIAIDINGHLVPKMKAKKWGRIIHISSIVATHLRGNGIYGTAKALLNNYTTILGRDLAADGIIVSSIMPGFFRSKGNHWDRVLQVDPESYKELVEKHLCIGRMGEVDDIVPFILFMASRHSRFSPGTSIAVDGGTV